MTGFDWLFHSNIKDVSRGYRVARGDLRHFDVRWESVLWILARSFHSADGDALH